MNKLTRRNFLKLSAASGAVLQLRSSPAFADLTAENSAIFAHGVASGDPTASRFIIWTRISVTEGISVFWQVATDKQFKRVVKSGVVTTSRAKDHTVKVDVGGLQSGSTYYYRFQHGGVFSPIGRSKTLPQGRVDKLNIAVASCSNYPFGFFNAYEHIAIDDSIDIVLHLGDYIYEYGEDGWGAESGKALGREHLPKHEIVSLADYRQRHAQYKADPASRLMHAAHPLICTWDDHESANNPYMFGAQNHDASEGDWAKRRAASIQAYYEWMPIREPVRGKSRAQLWRHYQFGDLATLTTLETRHTARAKQVDYATTLPSILNQSDRDEFMQKVLGDESRNMLSDEMLAFAKTNLADSKQQKIRWRLLGNQIPMARTHVPRIREKFGPAASTGTDPVADELKQLIKLGDLDLPLYLDTWDGYGAAREAFYNSCLQAGVQDLIVLTGDSHSFWANQLFTHKGKRMGVEIGATGISSPGDFESFGAEAASAFDKLLADHNKEVLWTTCQSRGYVKLSLDPKAAKAEYVAVDTVKSRTFGSKVINSFDIVRRDGSVEFSQG